MNNVIRYIKHLSATRWQVSRKFPASSLKAIEAAIAASEKSHMGELRFIVESGLELPALLSGLSARARALQVFSDLRIWDTEQNSGVLIYLLLAERKVEIVCDRGINKRVDQSTWNSICKNMEHHFRLGHFEAGALKGINAITQLLQKHFPAHSDNRDELSNSPVII